MNRKQPYRVKFTKSWKVMTRSFGPKAFIQAGMVFAYSSQLVGDVRALVGTGLQQVWISVEA